MGAGRRRRGVELRENSIRVHFTWNGERCRETLDLTPSEAHANYAARLVEDIRHRIELGTFDYREVFPNSERAKTTANTVPETFGSFCDLLLEKRSDLAPATASQYANELKRWRKRLGADRAMAEIRHSWLSAEVGKVKFPSPRMRNNSLIPLRAVFDLWVRDDPRGRVNPMDGIDNATVQKGKPDPFEWDEAVLIMEEMGKRYARLIALYFALAFNTGMRPEELIAFRWAKVDWRRARGLVDTVRTFKGGEKDVKTAVARWVDFNSAAMAALRELRALTELKPHEHVLENPRTGEPWHDERSQRDHYWKPTLKRLRLRPRRCYATRATRATAMLMRGMNPAYCARQLGQSKRVFFETYADWIDLAERYSDRERAKDEAEIDAQPKVASVP